MLPIKRIPARERRREAEHNARFVTFNGLDGVTRTVRRIDVSYTRETETQRELRQAKERIEALEKANRVLVDAMHGKVPA